MIPLFPEFRPLEFSDREEIIKHTSKFVPYSDFSFTSLWSWNVDNKIAISTIHGNLAIKFSDYETREPVYSLIGVENVAEATEMLINLAQSQGINSTLKLVPEETATLLAHRGDLIVREDRDNFDYIFSIEKLSTMAGAKLAAKRNHIRHFQKDHDGVLENLDIQTSKTSEEIMNICEEWAKHKKLAQEDIAHEFQAIERYFSMGSQDKHKVWGIRVGRDLVAFWAVEILDKKYAISHFQKAKIEFFDGAYPYLNQVGAQALFDIGISFINFEQDLGIPGLREGKSDYHPHGYLKKFTVAFA